MLKHVYRKRNRFFQQINTKKNALGSFTTSKYLILLFLLGFGHHGINLQTSIMNQQQSNQQAQVKDDYNNAYQDFLKFSYKIMSS